MARPLGPPSKTTTPTNFNPHNSRPNTTATPMDLDIITPSRRALSADPTPSSAPRSLHTPTTSLARLAVNSTRRSASARKGPAVARTPHGRAAIRALDIRRAAVFNTPGRAAGAGRKSLGVKRRRSIRDVRETPRDVLRNLSRVLAPTTAAIPSSSSPEKVLEGEETEESLGIDIDMDSSTYDDFPIARPRLSLPFGGDDDSTGSSVLVPPQSSVLDDVGNYTGISIEMPRRAVSEGPRGSLGRISDVYELGDPMGMGTPVVGVDSGFFPPEGIEEEEELGEMGGEGTRLAGFGDGDTGLELGGVGGGDFTMMGAIAPDVNESTVMMNAQAGISPDRVLPGLVEDDGAGQDYGGDSGPEDRPGGFEDYGSSEDEGGVGLDGDDEAMGMKDTGILDQVHNFDNELNDVDDTYPNPTKKKKTIKLSKHGLPYPSLPTTTIKRLATTFAQQSGVGKTKLSPETIAAVSQASDWFFAQVGDDLGAYARHAGRGRIDESDVIALLKRQRQVGETRTVFSLAERFLDRELLQELRIPAPKGLGKKKRMK